MQVNVNLDFFFTVVSHHMQSFRGKRNMQRKERVHLMKLLQKFYLIFVIVSSPHFSAIAKNGIICFL